MKSAVETVNPTRVKLTVEVDLDELRPSLDKAYRTIGAQISVPGFRRGKVPSRIVDQRVGRGTVLQEAINEALPGFYTQAVTESKVRVLGQPEVEVTAVPDGAQGHLEFTAAVDVRPEVTLPDYSTLSVTVDDVEVTDADVDGRLQALRQRFGTLLPVDRAAAAGDVVSLDMTASIGDTEIETVTGHSYEVGSGQLLDGTDEAVTGASKGDSKTFTTVLAGGEHAGEEAEVALTVVSVKERELPEADDDFAQMASEFETAAELLADLRAKAEDEAGFGQGIAARDKVLEALLEAVDLPVPDGVVETEVHQHLENENRLEDAEHRAEVQVEARKALRAQLLLDAVAEAEGVQVEQGELVEYIVAQAPRYGMEPQAFAQAMESSGQLPAVVAEVGRRKALSIVLGRATVSDASGRPVDLGDDDPDDDATPDGLQEGLDAELETGAELDEHEDQLEAATPAESLDAEDRAKAATEESAAEEPAAEKPVAEKPAAKKPAAKKPAADEGEGAGSSEKPAAKKPAAKKPAAKKAPAEDTDA